MSRAGTPGAADNAQTAFKTRTVVNEFLLKPPVGPPGQARSAVAGIAPTITSLPPTISVKVEPLVHAVKGGRHS